jgi:hypothetical protein
MKSVLFTTLCLSFLFGMTAVASNQEGVQQDNAAVKRWNSFADNIYQLHLKQTADREISTTERTGSYYRLPGFYQEVKYFDARNKQLLSKVQRETANPEQLHSVEAYIYDEQNRLIREYSATYLPVFHNAPYQTFMNLHHYTDGLHSFRQYDASDNLIYEVCSSTETGEKLYEHDDYEIPSNFSQGAGKDKIYQQCFTTLPRSAEKYLAVY